MSWLTVEAAVGVEVMRFGGSLVVMVGDELTGLEAGEVARRVEAGLALRSEPAPGCRCERVGQARCRFWCAYDDWPTPNETITMAQYRALGASRWAVGAKRKAGVQ